MGELSGGSRRSPSRAGHSRGVADLAARAGNLAGLPEADITTVPRAALLHDLGMHGIPATILDKPGPSSASESERMRMHPYYTERMLARPAAGPARRRRLADPGALRRVRLSPWSHRSGDPGTARVLAAACAFRAMNEPRPHRPAMTAKQAAGELHAAVRAGRLDADAVDRRPGRRRPETGQASHRPAGLTSREIEVLALIARGARRPAKSPNDSP